jgi:hypothetical protein
LPPVVFANSGKFLNDLGDYNNCLHHSKDYVYFTMSVFNKITMNNQFMGFCAPIECKELINSNNQTSNIQEILNQVFQESTNATFKPFIDMEFF